MPVTCETRTQAAFYAQTMHTSLFTDILTMNSLFADPDCHIKRCTDLIGLQLGYMVSSRQSSEMSDENQQQLLTLSQILT